MLGSGKGPIFPRLTEIDGRACHRWGSLNLTKVYCKNSSGTTPKLSGPSPQGRPGYLSESGPEYLRHKGISNGKDKRGSDKARFR
jgi:hypothetical protein